MATPTYSPTEDAWASYELAIELLRQRALAEARSERHYER